MQPLVASASPWPKRAMGAALGARLTILVGAVAEEAYFLGQREGALHCLGSCQQCHQSLQLLPRRRLEAAQHHTALAVTRLQDVEAWLAAPEVCDLLLMFPVDMRREAWSLAAMPAEDYLAFRGAGQDMQRTVEYCQALQLMSVFAWQGAVRAPQMCGQDSDCLSTARDTAFAVLARRWKDLRGPEAPPAPWAEVALGRNSTAQLLQQLLSLAEEAWQAKAQGEALRSLADGAAEAALGNLAVQLGRNARLAMEHARTIWGLKQLMLELFEVYPNLQGQMPSFRFQTRFYGRHFDVLEALLDSLDKGQELRMAELGVACGPVGLHLLARFPQLRYFGADPTIKEEVRDAYKPYADRAQLFASTSEEMHKQLDDVMDFVFIDGPHTYANVRNDFLAK
ncbi:unnamed protein product [Effrenium voratum]|nr:unnamed protein product [Effrenium voratum]